MQGLVFLTFFHKLSKKNLLGVGSNPLLEKEGLIGYPIQKCVDNHAIEEITILKLALSE